MVGAVILKDTAAGCQRIRMRPCGATETGLIEIRIDRSPLEVLQEASIELVEVVAGLVAGEEPAVDAVPSRMAMGTELGVIAVIGARRRNFERHMLYQHQVSEQSDEIGIGLC